MNKFVYVDGKGTKSFDRAMKYPDDAWVFNSDAPATDMDELYSSVAAVFRAANLTADAIGNLPFALVNIKTKKDEDTSEDWQNKLGLMKNPGELFRLFRLSLFFTNKAYAIRERVNRIPTLRFVVPTTMNPVQSRTFPYDLEKFERTVGTSKKDDSVQDVVHLFKLDHTSELLPSKNTEFKALMMAAGVLYYSDYFSAEFLSHGGIRPSMLMVKGVPNPDERTKIEKIWDQLRKGFYKYSGKVFNADSMEVKVIGDGMDALANKTSYQNKLSDIAMASGIPLSLLLANSANYATAQQEYAAWYRDSVTPWAKFIAFELTEQVFKQYGLRLEFRIEQTDPGQENEVARASAYKTYIDAQMLPSVAAQLVGLDLPTGMQFKDLDPKEEEKEPEIVDGENVEENKTPDIESDTEEIIPEPAKMFVPSIDQYEALAFWRDLCNRKMKRGESVLFDFENDILPEGIKAIIKSRLAGASDAEGIKSAFEMDISIEAIKTPDPAILELAASINKAVEAL